MMGKAQLQKGKNTPMRLFNHLTPTYIKNRISVLFYERAYPDHPWLTRSAEEILDCFLTKSDIGLEFGI